MFKFSPLNPWLVPRQVIIYLYIHTHEKSRHAREWMKELLSGRMPKEGISSIINIKKVLISRYSRHDGNTTSANQDRKNTHTHKQKHPVPCSRWCGVKFVVYASYGDWLTCSCPSAVVRWPQDWPAAFPSGSACPQHPWWTHCRSSAMRTACSSSHAHLCQQQHVCQQQQQQDVIM